MNLFVSTNLLRAYAEKGEWENATARLCHGVLKQIITAGPTPQHWQTLLELFAIWPQANDVQAWVKEIEPQVTEWPWQLRKCVLGHQATRGAKQSVYRLVGHLIIDNIEDLYGQKMARWAEIEHWQNLRGLTLFKVETEPNYLAALTQSPFLQGLASLELKVLDSLSGGMEVMFDNNPLPNLQTLSLISVGLIGNDIKALIKTAPAKHISALNLAGNYLNSDDLPILLAPAAFPNLQILDLSQMTISAEALQVELAKGGHPRLESVVIARTPAARSLGVEVLTI